ncbi:MAG TPA: hypothetical protein PLP45_02375 [Syntrophales bacterium]|nr:hypothetical protein [Syntrophales bacterium]
MKDEGKKRAVEKETLKTAFDGMEDALNRATDTFRASMAMMGLMILAMKENEDFSANCPDVDSLEIAKDTLSEKFYAELREAYDLMNKYADEPMMRRHPNVPSAAKG